MTDDDRTIDADPAALDELRRLAAQAEEQAGAGGLTDADDRTIDADDATLEHLRRLARDAEAHFPPPEARPPRELAVLDVAELDGLVARRPPAPPVPAEPWRPPPRSMRPASMPDVPARHASAVWRWLTLGLAAVLVVLVGWLLLDSDDAGEEVPTSIPGTPASGTVVTTGVLAEGGSGG